MRPPLELERGRGRRRGAARSPRPPSGGLARLFGLKGPARRDARLPGREREASDDFGPPRGVDPLPQPRKTGPIARAMGRVLAQVTLARLVGAALVCLGVYLWGFAANRYVAEASFVVRAGSISAGDEEDMLSIPGGQSTPEDTFAIHDFILSRDMVARLAARLDLREIFARGGSDPIFNYPSMLHGESREEFFDHYKLFVSVTFKTATGISTLNVQAFTPADAKALAEAILDESEVFVNDLNTRARRDALADAEERLEEARSGLIAAQTDLALFRSQELVLDPEKSSFLVLELVGRLSEELARVNTQISNLRQTAGNSPQLPALRARAAALQQQIMQERERTASASDGLAEKIAIFERLSVDHEIAVKDVTAAFRNLVLAQTQADRQRLYLQRITTPHQPDHPARPKRFVILVSAAVLLGIGAMLIWVLLSGLREHRPTVQSG